MEKLCLSSYFIENKHLANIQRAHTSTRFRRAHPLSAYDLSTAEVAFWSAR